MRRAGFTLIELTLCVAVICTLSLYVYRRTSDPVERTRVARVIRQVEICRAALARYVLEHDGRLPADAEALRPYLLAGDEKDPFVWSAARRTGRIAFHPTHGFHLVDEAGGRWVFRKHPGLETGRTDLVPARF